MGSVQTGHRVPGNLGNLGAGVSRSLTRPAAPPWATGVIRRFSSCPKKKRREFMSGTLGYFGVLWGFTRSNVILKMIPWSTYPFILCRSIQQLKVWQTKGQTAQHRLRLFNSMPLHSNLWESWIESKLWFYYNIFQFHSVWASYLGSWGLKVITLLFKMEYSDHLWCANAWRHFRLNKSCLFYFWSKCRVFFIRYLLSVAFVLNISWPKLCVHK